MTKANNKAHKGPCEWSIRRGTTASITAGFVQISQRGFECREPRSMKGFLDRFVDNAPYFTWWRVVIIVRNGELTVVYRCSKWVGVLSKTVRSGTDSIDVRPNCNCEIMGRTGNADLGNLGLGSPSMMLG